jgi:hypothetical protein
VWARSPVWAKRSESEWAKNFVPKRCEVEQPSLQQPEAARSTPQSRQEHPASWPRESAQLKGMPPQAGRLAIMICAVFGAM